MTRGLLCVLILLALPSTAQAVTVHAAEPAVAQVYQQALDVAPVRVPRGDIDLYYDPDAIQLVCDGYDCTEGHAIYLNGGDDPSDPVTVLEFIHEVGHVYDAQHTRLRELWKHLLGRDGDGWWSGADPPGEQFAQAYAWCSHDPSNRTASRLLPGYGYEPTALQHRRICAALHR